MTHEYMTVREIADLMRVQVDTVYRWHRKWQDFPQAVRQKRPLIWDGASFREWLANKD